MWPRAARIFSRTPESRAGSGEWYFQRPCTLVDAHWPWGDFSGAQDGGLTVCEPGGSLTNLFTATPLGWVGQPDLDARFPGTSPKVRESMGSIWSGRGIPVNQASTFLILS